MGEDIIVALATPWGEGGIAIVRLSGEGSVAITDKVFRSARGGISDYNTRYMAVGNLVDLENNAIYDEVLAVRFNEKSYTGEESVEIHCHGGFASSQRCIEDLCSIGARIALPGEFTRRAFVNGRIDLSQAEAVLGIIRARSDEALSASARTLQGNFTNEIKGYLDKLTQLAAQLEVDLDFPEEGEGFLSIETRKSKLSELCNHGSELVAKCKGGLMLREGLKVAILGQPNVGKSSLLNALLKEERAIVTSIPGTTRDRIEERFIHKGIPVKIIDTAGIRETQDTVESIGVSQALRSIEEADICMWVVDGAREMSGYEIEIGRKITTGKHIIVVNKDDIKSNNITEKLHSLFPYSTVVFTSALNNTGIEELKDLLVNEASGDTEFKGSYGVTARQLNCLINAINATIEARKANDMGVGNDVVISCISDARMELSSLLGLDASEDLLDVIFSSFCVGK